MTKPFVHRPSERELRGGIVRYGKLLADRDFAPATSGNISARLDGRRLLITPTGVRKEELREEDIVVVDQAGRRLSGRRPPTSELDMHRSVYELRPDAEAVVHAHPPTATAFACAGIALDQPLACEFVMGLGCAPLAPYATPGTEEVAASLRELAKGHDAILLSNHGAVTFGKSLGEAYSKMEMVEHFAKIALSVRLLGRQQPITEADILKLIEARQRYASAGKSLDREFGCPAGCPGNPGGPGREPRQTEVGRGAPRPSVSKGKDCSSCGAARETAEPSTSYELSGIVEEVVARFLTARAQKWKDSSS